MQVNKYNQLVLGKPSDDYVPHEPTPHASVYQPKHAGSHRHLDCHPVGWASCRARWFFCQGPSVNIAFQPFRMHSRIIWTLASLVLAAVFTLYLHMEASVAPFMRQEAC
jgi:hypothetical protein